MYLVTMAYVNAPSAVCVTTTSTGGKFSPVSNFMELHVLTLVATLNTILNHYYHSYSEQLRYCVSN